ncbi:MAG: hypothetical protein IT288_14335 [Bdellovibrionales bacterium]|nr:hypothetical protein [Bdellovibrionales bacterium]
MKQYLVVVLSILILGLGVVVISNAQLLAAAGRSFILDAYDWQVQTRGVVQTGNLTRNYKYYLIHRQRDELKTIVLGSSRSFGFRDFGRLPQPFYNLASEANPPTCLVEELQYILAQFPRLETIVVSIDLFKEFLHRFSACEQPVVDLLNGLPESALQVASQFDFPSLFSLNNARLSLNWIQYQLTTAQVGIAKVWESQPYRCPMGEEEGRDFLLLYPGQCNGYRPDGSNTYAYLRRESEVRLHRFLPPYQSKFEFKTEILDQTAELTRAFRQRGGRVLAFLPPVVPGVVEQLKNLKNPSNFIVARDEFIEYLKKKEFVVLDATDSGRFGCLESEFIDDQHADASCYNKVVRRLFP